MPFDRMMGIVPLGVGLTLLAFVWGSGAPLFFCVFASFVALGFVLTGAKLISGSLHDPARLRQIAEQLQSQLPETPDQPPSAPPGPMGYRCDSCGAPLRPDADVSPHGDVKCEHCNRWFNIHASTRS